MQDVLTYLQEFWQFVLVVAGGIGAFYRWRQQQKKSTELLYKELEIVKTQLIQQVRQEVNHAKTIALQDKLLNELQINCPDCYEQIMKNRKDAESL